MKKRTLILTAVFVLIGSLALADSPHSVGISSAEVDFGIGRIYISGHNFTLETPTIILAGTQLTLLSSTDTRVDAMLPPGIAPVLIQNYH